MTHLTQERVDWVDGRLFTLARTIRELRGNGLRWATQLTGNQHEAAALLNAALQHVNTERLALMGERAAITTYEQEQAAGKNVPS